MEIDKSILIIGQISSGKSTLANRLAKELALKKASFGGYLLNYCELSEIADRSRDNLQAIGQRLIDNDHNKFLHAVIDFSAKGSQQVIFEGVRHLSIFDGIRKMTKHISAVYLEATYSQRLSRYLSREKKIDLEKTEAEFAKANAHCVEQEIPKLKEYCNLVISSADDPEVDYAVMKAFLSGF
jgi:cytidylate kinase